MKKIIALLSVLMFSMSACAGRMPESIKNVEALGKGYVKLNILKSSPNDEYDYQIVSAVDIKRMVGDSTKKSCYIFYFTGIELLKIQVTHQACTDIVKELMAAQS